MAGISLTNRLAVTLGSGGNGVVAAPSMFWSSTMKHADITVDSLLATQTATNTTTQVLADTSYATGKRYFEVQMTGLASGLVNCAVGVRPDNATYTGWVGATNSGYGWFQAGRFYANNSLITNFVIPTWQLTNTQYDLQVAVDIDAGEIWFGLGNVWAAQSGTTPDPAAGTFPAMTGLSGTLYPAASFYSVNCTAELHASASNVVNTLPSGFVAWDS